MRFFTADTHFPDLCRMVSSDPAESNAVIADIQEGDASLFIKQDLMFHIPVK